MGFASNKIAGPLDIDPKVLERDALIREDNDGEATRNNLAAIQAALEKGGVSFVDDDKQLGVVAPRAV